MRRIYAAALVALTLGMGACSADPGQEAVAPVQTAQSNSLPTLASDEAKHPAIPKFDFESMMSDPDRESLVFGIQARDADGIDYENATELSAVELNVYYLCPPEMSIEVSYRTDAGEVPADWGISCEGNGIAQVIDLPQNASSIEGILLRAEGTGAWGVTVTAATDGE